MRVRIDPGPARGTMKAPPSKSMAHRLLICAGFADGESVIRGVDPSEDVLATTDCLRALGAELRMEDGNVSVRGCDPRKAGNAELRCRESGSTLRFMIPPALLSDTEKHFTGSEKLMSRPLSVYEDICREQGILLRREAGGLKMRGTLRAGEYEVPGDISSQFISGLMFAMPLKETDSTIRILPPVESRSYLDLTVQALRDFGITAAWDGPETLRIPGGQAYRPRETAVEGDYSNAAYLEILNDAGGNVTMTGLRADSLQGDRVYGEYLRQIREGIPELDVTDCPDLAPALIAAAALHHGARLTGTRRLRLKESDRGAAMAEEMAKFGIRLENGENEIVIPAGGLHWPSEPLSGHNDHRIVMALAAVCMKTGGEIEGAEAVRKSFPDYWEWMKILGIRFQENGEQRVTGFNCEGVI